MKDQSTSTIENFSNEIFVEIFDYLDGSDVLVAFSSLNSRFQRLLHSSSLQLNIQYSFSQPADVFIHNWKQFVSDHSEQVHSVDLYYRAEISSSLNIDSSFIQLRSLQLIVTDVVKPLLESLHQLPCLQSLKVRLGKSLPDLTDFYQTFFTLPKLKSCQISNDYYDSTGNSTVSLPLANENQFTPIESIGISHPCTFDELETIVSYMPELRFLSILQMYGYVHLSPLDLSNLTSLTIESYIITFDELEKFLGKIQSQLNGLHIVNYTEDLDYLDAQRWEDYLSESFPHLKHFSLRNLIEFTHSQDFPFETFEKNQFTSPFWTKRQLTTDILVESQLFVHRVSQYRYQ